MDLVYSIALLGLTAVLGVFVFLTVRMPVQPAWGAEWMIANVWCVAITGLLTFGIGLGIRYFNDPGAQPVGLREVILIAAFLSVYSGLLRLMAPRRRLAEYAAQLRDSESAALKATAPESSRARAGSDGEPPTDPSLRKVA